MRTIHCHRPRACLKLDRVSNLHENAKRHPPVGEKTRQIPHGVWDHVVALDYVIEGNAITIATIAGDAAKTAIFGYEPGVAMPGLTAPAWRLAIFLGDDSAEVLNNNGIFLYRVDNPREFITAPSLDF